ncbi:MAG: hypothetical protein K6A36_02445 [Paludibacteraceae bacterium]|nr:hypothetical protein [Paludibacteraceae bacterium]
MTKRLSLLFVFTLMAGWMMSQAPVSPRPQRTPEDEAMNQTERLVRELNIRDSARIDTLYRMHLKFARTRSSSMTRAEHMDRMSAIVAELKNILTPEEFERFMNHSAELPRRPHGANMMSKPDVVIIQRPTQTKQNR